MILTEAHIIRKNRKTGELFRRIDNYCYRAKNLHNAVNYRIKQCSRICRKLREEKTLEEWEQEVSMGKKTNQNFVGIPYDRLIEMIRYKAALAGIRVVEIEESYTSGTSYLDGEQPVKKNYDKSRRIHRGLFRSNKGILINADVNAAYQIMKKAGFGSGETPKSGECVRRIKAA